MFSKEGLRTFVKKNMCLHCNIKTNAKYYAKSYSGDTGKVSDLIPIEFYSNYVVFMTRQGFTLTFSYYDCWNLLLGREQDGLECISEKEAN